MVTNFVWDELSDNVRMEVDEAGALTAEYMNEPGQFGNLLTQRRGGTKSFYHFDAQGSTRHLTTDAQVVSDSYAYSAYGELVSSSGTTNNPFRYKGVVGYYTNSETNDFYIRRRTYQPILGRWISSDPSLFSDGLNLYMYVSNRPMNAIDPSGTVKITAVAQSLSGSCNTTPSSSESCIRWQWNLSAEWPCLYTWGYYVQKVEAFCEINNCDSACPTDPSVLKPYVTFLEAVRVERKTTTVYDIANGYCRTGTCGISGSRGLLKFFCGEQVKKLEEADGWRVDKPEDEPFGTAPCSIRGGPIVFGPIDEDKPLPDWWEKSDEAETEPEAKRWFILTWDCCDYCGGTTTCEGGAYPKMEIDNVKPTDGTEQSNCAIPEKK